MVAFSTKAYLTLTPLMEISEVFKLFAGGAANVGGTDFMGAEGIAATEETPP